MPPAWKKTTSPGAAPAVLLLLPNGLHLAGGLEPIKRRVERTFLEPQQAAAAQLESPQDFQPMRFTLLERGQDERF